MLLGNVIDQFHDDHGLTDIGTAKRPISCRRDDKELANLPP